MEKVEKEEKKKETCKKWTKDHIQLLVICSNSFNYIELFKGCKVDGVEIKTDQASWDELSLSCYEPTKMNPFGLVVEILPKTIDKPFKDTDQWKRRTIRPDFLLIRNVCRSKLKTNDNRNVLFGFLHSGIPSINNLFSMYCNLERVVMHGGMKQVERKLGNDKFPLIEQNYHAYAQDINFTPDFPCVAKIAHAHAGIGKILVKNARVLRDVKSIVQIHDDYCTTERFIHVDYELRLQKIGKNYRSMKKYLTGERWKSNELGGSVLTDIEVTKTHKLWLDEVSKLFGGMDVLALDVLRGKDGKDYILELNDSAIGFFSKHTREDCLLLKDLVIEKMREKLIVPKVEKKKSVKDVNDFEVKIINMKNKLVEQRKNVDFLRKKLKTIKEENVKYKTYVKRSDNDFNKTLVIGSMSVFFCVFLCLLIFHFVIGFKN